MFQHPDPFVREWYSQYYFCRDYTGTDAMDNLEPDQRQAHRRMIAMAQAYKALESKQKS